MKTVLKKDVICAYTLLKYKETFIESKIVNICLYVRMCSWNLENVNKKSN